MSAPFQLDVDTLIKVPRSLMISTSH